MTRSGSGEPELQTVPALPWPVGQERLLLTPFGIRRSRTTDMKAVASVGQERLLLTRSGSGDPELQSKEQSPHHRTGYLCFFNSPNVVNARFEAETGPGNRRITNGTDLPSNETSSI